MNNISITFFMPSSPLPIDPLQSRPESDRGSVAPAGGFLKSVPLIGRSVVSVTKWQGDVNKSWGVLLRI
jgi:hypothetical protein